jgi:TPR repeat protein
LKVVDAGSGIGEVRHCKRMPTAREAVGETRDLAERGDVWSQLELGELYAAGANYADGASLPRDQLEAYKWFSIAAADKRARDLAARLRDAVGAGMNAGQIAEAEQRARAWVEASGKPRP